MILYRLQGRCELFSGCGMVYITPIIDSSLSSLRKKANKYIRDIEKKNLTYRIGIQKLTMKEPSKKLLIDTMTTEDVEELVADRLWIKKWEGDYCKPDDLPSRDPSD